MQYGDIRDRILEERINKEKQIIARDQLCQLFMVNVKDNDEKIENTEELVPPKNYKDTLKHVEATLWKEGMNEEELWLIEKGVFVYVDKIPEGKESLRSRWVYAYKRDENGKIIRRECRLVAKGYAQIPGLEYWYTFALTARLSPIKLILSIAAKQNMYLHSIDYTRAFCNPILHEEIYMKLPNGKLIKLLKALYGLKQAAAEWYMMIRECMKTLGFKRSHTDDWVFVHTKIPNTIVVVYVDDIIIMSETKEKAMIVYEQMKKIGTCTDQRRLSCF